MNTMRAFTESLSNVCNRGLGLHMPTRLPWTTFLTDENKNPIKTCPRKLKPIPSALSHFIRCTALKQVYPHPCLQWFSLYANESSKLDFPSEQFSQVQLSPGQYCLDFLQASQEICKPYRTKVILMESGRLISGLDDTKEHTQSFPVVAGDACRTVGGGVWLYRFARVNEPQGNAF